MKNQRHGSLLKNTVMLYILQFSTYFFSLITVPYQTRVLGKIVFGQVGFAVSVMTYFQLFMDFGFMLSATEDISKNRNDPAYINRKLTSIAVLKVFLSAISFLIMLALCFTVPKFHAQIPLFLIYVAAYMVNSLMPDYVYRGVEKMTAITVRSFCIRLFSTICIFVFLRKSTDYLVIPILLLIGNSGAVFAAYWHLFKRLGYRFAKVGITDVWNDFKRSFIFFVSRIASTVYSSTNTVILGFVDKVGVMTSYYTSADRVLTTAKNGLSPISDSLYPYMVENKDFKLVKKILSFFMPVIVLGCIGVGIFARPICALVFGKDFADTAPILIALLPAIAAILPSYILGFPTLGAMNKSKLANLSVVIGTVFQLLGLLLLFLLHKLDAVHLAALTSCSEWVILLFRLGFVLKYRKEYLNAE